MIDDPYTYDISAFSREFTWAILFWNQAESKARWLLSGLLGAHETSLALVSDLGSRTLSDALHSTGRGLEDESLKGHVLHFSKGYDCLCQHRNLYVHGLMALAMGEPDANNVKPLHGRIMTMKGRGRLKAVEMNPPTADVTAFKDWCLRLSSYGEAIMRELGLSDDTFQKMLEMPDPSLDQPEWPGPPEQQVYYVQD